MIVSSMPDVSPPPAEISGDLPASGGIVRPRRRIFVSTSSLFASNVLITALGAVALRLMTHRLGPDAYGVFVTAGTFVSTWELLTDLGINALVGREVSRTPQDAGRILSYNLGLRLSLSAVLIPIVWVVGNVIYRSSPADVRFGVLIVALSVPFDAIRAVSLGYYVASISNHWVAAINLLQQVLWVSGLALALALGAGVKGCFGAYLGSVVVLAAVAYLVVRHKVRFRPRFTMANWIQIIRQSITIGVIGIVNYAYLKADIILLSLMTTVYQVAIYGVAYAVINFFLFIPSAFMTSVLPVVTRGRHDELKTVIEWAVAYMASLGCLISAGIICLGSPVVHLLAGSKFASAASPLSILAISIVFSALTNVFGYASFARNRHHKLLYISLSSLVLNVLLNLFAIPRWGVNGSASATVISEAFVLGGTYLVFRQGVGIRMAVVRPLLRPAVAAGIAIAVFRFWLWFPHAGVALTLLLGFALTGLFVGVLALLRGLPPDLRVVGRRALNVALRHEA
jgi:O-antigen/teichoic acid export membrane protein